MMQGSTEMAPTPAVAEAASQLSLRERKYARTKMALLDAALERLKQKPLADITVRELCDAAEVSEATFFNYFKKKDDLLRYFIQIWTLEVRLHAQETAGPDAGLSFIEAIYSHTAERMAENPRIMLEIIAHIALHGDREAWQSEMVPLSPAERVYAFPESNEAVTADECELEGLFRPAVERAQDRKELPRTADADVVVSSLIAIFFGTPLWHAQLEPADVRSLYAAQLATLWAGLRGR